MKALRRTPRAWACAVTGAAALCWMLAAPPVASAGCPPGSPGNEIEAENCKDGSPASEWDVSGAGSRRDPGLRHRHQRRPGFDESTSRSARRPPTIASTSTAWAGTAAIGARLVTTVQPSAPLPQSQPGCLREEATTGLVDCGNWAVSAALERPADATSGIYFAKLVAEDGTSGSSHVYFIVRDDDGRSDLLFQTSDTTWQAYNQYGGNSLYVGSPAGRAYKVSYNRPLHHPGLRARGLPSSTPSTRWSAGWSATATTSPTSRASTATGAAPRSASTRPSCPSATTSTGPAPSARTSRRPAMPA